MILRKNLVSCLLHQNIGIHRTGKKLWNQMDCQMHEKIWKSGIAWLKTFISDDDSLSRAALRHPILMQILNNKIQLCPIDKNGWPVGRNRRKVKDTGKLLLQINSVNTYLADLSHHHHVYGGQLYKQEPFCKEMKKLTVNVSFTILVMQSNRIMRKQKKNLSKQ